MASSVVLGPSAVSERYHSLDALRAAMMLLGIVLHATWFFVPVWSGHPITDVSANWGLAHFFYWIHLFRMQAFFLVAGFFAHLLLQRRGLWRFLGNRVLRIGVPFLLFTALLYPIMSYQGVLGGLLSGRIQSEQTARSLWLEELSQTTLAELWPIHFWFLYCLLLLYGVSLVLLLLFRVALDRQGRVRERVHRALAGVLSARWGVLILAIPVAGHLYWTDGWFGINAGPLKPLWSGVFAYWVFFAIGWCMHQQPALLRKHDRGWAWRIAVGGVLGLMLSGVFYQQLRDGRMSFFYPMIADTTIRDFELLRERLMQSAEEGSSPLAAHIWQKLAPEYQHFIATVSSPTSDQRAGIGFELSKAAILDVELAGLAAVSQLDLPAEAQAALAVPADQRTLPETMELNRNIVEAVFTPAIASFWQAPVWYRAAFFYGYALCSWLLVFGFLGFFSYACAQTSIVFRYLADSSYWLYIVHLPLQFQLQLWIAPWQVPWLPKVVLYMAYPTVVGLLTYHFLVRSTFLGVLLNGRRYPFVWRMPRLSARKIPRRGAGSLVPEVVDPLPGSGS
jgi:peptidoglycan/LPS O-acetylase OafA/YrhL